MNILSKFQVPSSNGLGGMCFEDLEEKDESSTLLNWDQTELVPGLGDLDQPGQ